MLYVPQFVSSRIWPWQWHQCFWQVKSRSWLMLWKKWVWCIGEMGNLHCVGTADSTQAAPSSCCAHSRHSSAMIVLFPWKLHKLYASQYNAPVSHYRLLRGTFWNKRCLPWLPGSRESPSGIRKEVMVSAYPFTVTLEYSFVNTEFLEVLCDQFFFQIWILIMNW